MCACYSYQSVVSCHIVQVLHNTFYHSHIVNVIVMLVFIVLLCSFSFGSVVHCFICCSLYVFMFSVLLFSFLPVSSASLFACSSASVISSAYFVWLFRLVILSGYLLDRSSIYTIFLL